MLLLELEFFTEKADTPSAKIYNGKDRFDDGTDELVRFDLPTFSDQVRRDANHDQLQRLKGIPAVRFSTKRQRAPTET